MSSMLRRNLMSIVCAIGPVLFVGWWVYANAPQERPVPPKKLDTPKADPAGADESKAEPNKAEAKAEKPPIDEPRRMFFKGNFKGGRFGKTSRSTLSDRLGVRVEKPSDETLVQLGLPEGEGLSVEEVREGSAAATVGIKVGDILLSLGGQTAPSDVAEFHFRLGELKANEPIDAVLLRKGEMMTLTDLILPEPTPRFTFPRRPPFNPPPGDHP